MNLLKNIISLRIVPCHRRCDRSFHSKGKKFPVCARCTGLILGYFSLPFWYLVNIALPILLTLLIVFLSSLPLLIDGYTQKWKWRESNNLLRLLTGLLCSISISLGIVEFSNFLLELILKLV